MLLVPYRADVAMKRWPLLNWGIIGLCVVGFAAGLNTVGATRLPDFVLVGWNLKGLFGHMWAHAGPVHLLGNMIFLWVFGNAVCAKVGNLAYGPLYVGLGVVAALPQAFAGAPTVGASGAINGIVGMYLVFYPVNPVSCFYLVYPRQGLYGVFTMRGYWMILFWWVFDLLGLLLGGEGVAYAAHLAGLGSGAAVAVLLLATKLIEPDRYEQTLLDVLSGERKPRRPR